MVLQLAIKVETNLKLDLIDLNQNSMIEDKQAKEVHFLQLETVTDRYEIGWKVFKELWRAWTNPSLKFDRWYITDFDNCLEGNRLAPSDSLEDENEK